MTIINVRGTSGSGKSTLVRRLIGHQFNGQTITFREPGRKRPIGTLHHPKLDMAGPPLAVLGHYETDCGGCDTIPEMERIFELVRKAHEQGAHVVFEGLLISADVNRTQALHDEGLPLHVVALDVSLEECLASVNGRREQAWKRRVAKTKAQIAELDAKGSKAKRPAIPEHPGEVNPRNTESKWKGVKQSVARLEAAGVDCHTLGRDEALEFIKRKLL